MIGSGAVLDYKFGSLPVVKLYKGTTLVWAAVEDTDPYLTIDITGVDDDYEVAVDDVVWPLNRKSFPSGTILDNLTVTVSGYTIVPGTIDNVLITGNTTLYFTATPVETGTIWNLQNLEILNGNDFYPTGGDARGWTTGYILAGGIGSIQGRSNVTIFGLDEGEWSEPYHAISYGVWRANGGNASYFNNNTSEFGVSVPADTLLRVRCDGTLIHQEYTLNDVDWLPLLTPPVEQPNVPLYGKISTDPGEYVKDVLLTGFITP